MLENSSLDLQRSDREFSPRGTAAHQGRRAAEQRYYLIGYLTTGHARPGIRVRIYLLGLLSWLMNKDCG